MMQKPLFKLFVWIAASSFFFIGSAVLITLLGPTPSEDQIMKYMHGMMSSMTNSTMGLSMAIEGDAGLKSLILSASSVTIPLVILGALAALFIKVGRS